ncbi:MAG TPA: hypothetical protein VLA88_05035 [Candidatus Saccharimonadales bacterium]|nr:hypothetical protein [Candidatus Saccharimonadales bacterium]
MAPDQKKPSPYDKPKKPRILWLDKPPVFRRFWTYVWLLALLGIALMAVFGAWHGYHFPCRIGNGGAYNCDADSATRWTAAIRDGFGAVCIAPCALAFLGVLHAAWAYFVRPELLKSKYLRAGISPERYEQYPEA